jgi:hypothetical protein
MEEQLSNIGEVMKGFRENIHDLKLKRKLRTPPEVHVGRVQTRETTISKIKKIEDECTKICEESVQGWKEIMGGSEMKAIEAKLREVQYHAHEEEKK